MIYLTLDTNIWLYLLNDSWKEYNPFDHLEHWMKEGHIAFLVPEIVEKEWDKHREAHKNECREKIREFFEMAKDIVPSAFITDQNKPDAVEAIVEKQFGRIEELLKVQAIKAPFLPETNAKLVDWGLEKKAPLHKKTSMADAMIIFSVFDFAKLHQGDEFIFISNNKEDFFETINGKRVIHSDLQPLFSEHHIAGYRNLRHVIADLAKRLPVTVDLAALRQDRLKHKIAEKLFNPVVMKSLENIRENYLADTKYLEDILIKEDPSKPEVLIVLGLLEADESYRQFFYRRVESPLWFHILKEKGVFDPSNNPAPVPVDKGFHIPLWEPMLYAEKLAKSLAGKPDDKLADELLTLVSAISSHPSDNFHTRILLIRIVCCLPNEKITEQVLNYIPAWLSGNFTTTLESMELCEHLLPKFLNDAPTSADIQKANLILRHLLAISRLDQPGTAIKGKYSSRLEIRFLSAGLNSGEMPGRMARYCGDELILFLGGQIKHLIYDYPNGARAHFHIGETRHEVNFSILNEDLKIRLWQQGMEENALVIPGFELVPEAELLQRTLDFIRDTSPAYEPEQAYEDPLYVLRFILHYDSTAAAGSSAIYELEGQFNDENVIGVFTYTFRNLLAAIARQDTERALRLFRIFCYAGIYKTNFFRRVAFYVIGMDWMKLKLFFWELLAEEPEIYFTESEYRKDLYHLLSAIAPLLTQEEKDQLDGLITCAFLSEPTEEKRDYQRQNWYAALREVSPFKEKYHELIATTGNDFKHYEDLGVVKLRPGSVSPLSVGQLLEMEHPEIVSYIFSFKPKRIWDDYSVDGLAAQLGRAIAQEPEHFTSALPIYQDVYFIYAYYILMGFQDAWKAKKDFEWKPVLDFISAYITDDKFGANALKLENDSWNADKNWVAGAAGTLLGEGMHADSHALPEALLPEVKKLLALLMKEIEPETGKPEQELDFAFYLVNSTPGKVLRALFNYSLFRSRNLADTPQPGNWETDVRALFEAALQKGFSEAYIMFGMYYLHFNYLDKEWTASQVTKCHNADTAQWRSFIGGLAIAQPPYTPALYDELYPHYNKAISVDTSISGKYDKGLIRHFLAIYFFGLEELKPGGLLFRLISESAVAHVLALVHLFWGQQEYINNLKEEEKPAFRIRILALWKMLADRYRKPAEGPESEIVAGLVTLLFFFDEIGGAETELVLKSIPSFKNHNRTHELMEHLNRMKAFGEPANAAPHIATILPELSFDAYISEPDRQTIHELAAYLYEHKQKKAANEFCNRVSRMGNEFLKELYRKNHL